MIFQDWVTWKKGEPVSLGVAATSSGIEILEKGELVPLDIAAMSPEMKTSEKGEPVPIVENKSAKDYKTAAWYFTIPNKIQVVGEHEQYTVFVFVVKQ